MGALLCRKMGEGVEEMKRALSLFIMVSLLLLSLAGCGPATSEDVVGSLSKQVEKMEGYKSKATLALQTGKTPQEYEVEVWYKKPNFYRIAITSKQRDITQIILRNDEGVFVLTPHLNKSFRFQSEWPEKHGQVYLYESLAKSIVSDAARKFQGEGEQYAFEVKADYQNRSLTKQKIMLNKSLEPVRVDVMDSNMNTMVTVQYRSFELNPKFDADAFDKERNMQAAILDSVPAMANPSVKEYKGSFGVIEPNYLPENVALKNIDRVKDKDGEQIILSYQGKYSFRIMENKSYATTVSFAMGEPVDLGYTVGVMAGEERKTLRWDYDGVEYTLSGAIPAEEMIEVARSMFNQVGK
jgi:outer membrane lipoprotein-sorting protein